MTKPATPRPGGEMTDLERSQAMSQTEGKMTREHVGCILELASRGGRVDDREIIALCKLALAHDANREGVLEIGLLKAVRDIAMCRMSGHGAVSMEEFGPWARNIAIKAVEEHDNALASRADSAAVEGLVAHSKSQYKRMTAQGVKPVMEDEPAAPQESDSASVTGRSVEADSLGTIPLESATSVKNPAANPVTAAAYARGLQDAAKYHDDLARHARKYQNINFERGFHNTEEVMRIQANVHEASAAAIRAKIKPAKDGE